MHVYLYIIVFYCRKRNKEAEIDNVLQWLFNASLALFVFDLYLYMCRHYLTTILDTDLLDTDHQLRMGTSLFEIGLHPIGSQATDFGPAKFFTGPFGQLMCFVIHSAGISLLTLVLLFISLIVLMYLLGVVLWTPAQNSINTAALVTPPYPIY